MRDIHNRIVHDYLPERIKEMYDLSETVYGSELCGLGERLGKEGAVSTSSKMKHALKKVVRVGKLEDQDRWRREDCARMTPNERLNALVDFRYRSFPDEMKSVKKVVAVRRLLGCSTDA